MIQLRDLGNPVRIAAARHNNRVDLRRLGTISRRRRRPPNPPSLANCVSALRIELGLQLQAATDATGKIINNWPPNNHPVEASRDPQVTHSSNDSLLAMKSRHIGRSPDLSPCPTVTSNVLDACSVLSLSTHALKPSFWLAAGFRTAHLPSACTTFCALHP